MLALIAVKPDLISVTLIETLHSPKWKILFPAVGIKFRQQDMERRQRNKWDPFMLLQDAHAAGCLGDLLKEDNITSLSFLNNTIVMLMKIYGFYIVLVPLHLY